MIEGSQVSPLPSGWVWTTLEDISGIVLGQSPPSSTYNDKRVGLPFYQGKLEFGKLYPSPKVWCSAPRKTAEKGDVLISVRAPVGPTNICPEKSCIGRGLAAIRGLADIEPLFLLHLLRTYENVLAGKGTGTTFKAISGGQLRGLTIPLPPLAEQRRIVAKIEEIFSRLDAGTESLKQARVKLRLYRQAVLKNGFEGKLTREWRDKHRDEIEPASAFLEQFITERKMVERGKLKELFIPEVSVLADLPSGWVWGSWSLISEWVTYGFTRPMPHVEKGIPIVTAKNIVNGKIRFENTDKTTTEAFMELSEKDRPRRNDMLLTKDGSIGRAAIVDTEESFCINQSVAVIWLRSCPMYRKYLLSVIESPFTQDLIWSKARGVALKHLSISDFPKMPLPIPPLLEQQKIAEEIERHFSIIDKSETIISLNLESSERLNQSVLKRAFEGSLVRQDPCDEPADKLIARIRDAAQKETKSRCMDRMEKKVDGRQWRLIPFVE